MGARGELRHKIDTAVVALLAVALLSSPATSVATIQEVMDEAPGNPSDAITEVYLRTWSHTAAFQDATMYGDDENPSNVGRNVWLYHFGARNAGYGSADELVVTIDLIGIVELGGRLETLWTAKTGSSLNHDRTYTILYRTNKTGASERRESQYDSSHTKLGEVTTDTLKPNGLRDGWRLWSNDITLGKQKRLDIDCLNLDNDEYLLEVRIIFSAVEGGFQVGQRWDEEDPHAYGRDMSLLRSITTPAEKDFSFSVKAIQALGSVPSDGSETVIRCDISSQLLKAGVLCADDRDWTQTRIYDSFDVPCVSDHGFAGFSDSEIASFDVSTRMPDSDTQVGLSDEHEEFS